MIHDVKEYFGLKKDFHNTDQRAHLNRKLRF